MDMICRLYHLFTIFICLASVVVGFGSFAVLGCKDLWNNTNHLAKWYGHVMRCLELRSPCVSLKIVAHLRTFDSQSDSSIQRPHSIILYMAWIILKEYIILATNSLRRLCFFFFQISHDFAVNFNEDNPECAGMMKHSSKYFIYSRPYIFNYLLSADALTSPCKPKAST